MITLFVSCGHCIVCPSSIYDFWLPLWYLVAVVLSVLPRLTTSDDPFRILWPLYCLSFLDLRLLIIPFGILWPLYCLSFLVLRFLITPLVSCGLYIIFPSSISDFWLPLWYLVAIILSVLPRFPTSDYPFGILWPLYCLSFLDLRLLVTPLVSCGQCIVCPSSIYEFWLPLWYPVAIVLSVLPRLTTSDYLFGITWSFYCLSFLDLRFLITYLVSCGLYIVFPSSIYDFWLPLWYLLAIVLSVLPRFTTSDYPFWYLVAIVLSVLPRFTTSDYPFWYLVAIVLSFPPRFTTSDYPFVSCGHCIVFSSSIYDFWLPLWYLMAVVLSVLPRFTTSDYPFGTLWPLYFRPSSIYDFWLPLWYLVAIVLSVLPRFTTSDYPFGIL